ncbi:putative nicotinate-nucleotide adenylyltransferase [Desulfosarcina widdelii]|uniref:Probable nicotinate-nucleotide adenylyltransferase n=1 Tax=Desulfosarcina widdelii TaxID=947919 RepID=A0A5K7ZB40_9BACT|nr:nicotinate-nucleotide adenylyltransferase [Desulfosarcina widdelii]BBO78000.1 putative nicotinate-nucleotide adenylyltransferase [Desulfosarcina widdelii]
MRAGLFGGTFNPIHKGHLMVAEQVVERFFLDRLYIIPCREPPHKSPDYLAPATDRVRMVRLALPGDSRYRLSEVEIRRSGPSYTIDTVTHFAAAVVPGATLFLVMGMDAFLEIHTWKRWLELFERVQLVVVTRQLDGESDADADRSIMDGCIRARLPGEYTYDEKKSCWQNVHGACIHLLETLPVAVSSSQVRRRIKAGRPIANLVPPAVKAYIEEKELYR